MFVWFKAIKQDKGSNGKLAFLLTFLKYHSLSFYSYHFRFSFVLTLHLHNICQLKVNTACTERHIQISVILQVLHSFHKCEVFLLASVAVDGPIDHALWPLVGRMVSTHAFETSTLWLGPLRLATFAWLCEQTVLVIVLLKNHQCFVLFAI